MVRRLAASLALALAAASTLLSAGCAAPQVVREGPGWREVKVSDTQTRVELTADDPATLAGVARTHADPTIRGAAVDKITDPAVLADVARQDADAGVRRKAVSKIADRRVLIEIAQADADPGVQALAAERRDLLRWIPAKHPEYAAWARRGPGTSVRYRAELKVNGATSVVEILRTLAGVSPDGAVIEQRNAATGKALEGTIKTLFDRAETPAGRRVDGEESIEVRGRRVECATSLTSGQFGGVIARIKIWRCDEVPGGVARLDVEESPQGEPLRYLRALAIQW